MKHGRPWRLATTMWLVTASAAAQTPKPSPTATPRPGEVVLRQPVAPPGRRAGRAQGGPDPSAATAKARYAGGLQGMRALEIAEGRARVLLDGGERVMVPGTVIGSDTVASVTPGRIVLRRASPEKEGGDSIVIVTFDERGRTTMRVIAVKDPTTVVPAEVK